MSSLIKALAAVSVLSGGLLAASAAQADVLYNNSPLNGNIDSYGISSGYSAADSFTLSSAATVTGVDFGVWNLIGDVTTSVDWSIVTSPTGGSVVASGTAGVVATSLGNNGGFDLYTDTISIPDVSLAAGSYWIELQNAGSGSGTVAWDVNDGPSSAWDNIDGYVTASNAFDIKGTETPVPEPVTVALLGGGLLGLAGLRRRKAV